MGLRSCLAALVRIQIACYPDGIMMINTKTGIKAKFGILESILTFNTPGAYKPV